MSGMEIVAIIGAVAAVVSAFEHGDALVKRIKAKREAKKLRNLPPTTLEQSLIRGPRDVRYAYASGVETYGAAFRVENDRVANDAFKDIIIQLQGTLLRCLAEAQDDNSFSDFTVVLDAANVGRMRSVNVLNELYMRMMQAAPLVAAPQHATFETSDMRRALPPAETTNFMVPTTGHPWNMQPQGPGVTMDSAGRYLSQDRTLGPPALMAVPSAGAQSVPVIQYRGTDSEVLCQIPSPGAVPVLQTQQPVDNNLDANLSPTSGKKRFRNLFASPKAENHASSKNSPPKAETTFVSPPVSDSLPKQRVRTVPSSSASSIRRFSTSTSSPPLTGSQTSNNRNETDFEAPVEEPSNSETSERLPSPSKNRFQRANSGSQSPSARPDTESPSPPTVKSKLRRFSLNSNKSTKSSNANYGGFCKGAALMQIGQPGMNLKDDPNSSKGAGKYFSCCKCHYEGPALHQSHDGRKKSVWAFDNTIQEMHGVRYRWTFLAKSHIDISNTYGGHTFQCIFCAGQGRPTQRIEGEPAFIQHVSTHQGRMPDRSEMNLFKHIVGRHAYDEEDFDVNLVAPLGSTLDSEEIDSTRKHGLGIRLEGPPETPITPEIVAGTVVDPVSYFEDQQAQQTTPPGTHDMTGPDYHPISELDASSEVNSSDQYERPVFGTSASEINAREPLSGPPATRFRPYRPP